MSASDPRFLSRFFISLALILTAAVAVRIASYEPREPRPIAPMRTVPMAAPAATLVHARGLREQPTPEPRDATTSAETATAAPELMKFDSTSRPAPAPGAPEPGIIESARVERATDRPGSDVLLIKTRRQAAVRSMKGRLISRSGAATIPFDCSGERDSWRCSIPARVCVDCGRWRVGYLEVVDAGGRSASVAADTSMLSDLSVYVRGETCDASPPVVHVMSLDQTVIRRGADPITVILSVQDFVCGVERIEGYAVPQAGESKMSIPFSAVLAGDEHTWTARISLPRAAPPGTWKIESIIITDRAANQRIYSTADALLRDVDFRVE